MELKLLKSKKFIAFLALVLFFMGGLYLNTSKILLEAKSSIVTKLETKLNTEIEVKDLNIAWFNKLLARDLTIKDKSGRNLLQADEVVISYSIIDLLFDYSKPLEIIKDIELNNSQINLIQEDKWNYNFLLSSNSNKEGSTTKDLFPIYINQGTVQVESLKLTEKITKINGTINLSKTIGVFLDGEVASLKARLESDLIINDKEYQGEVKFSNLELDNLTNKSKFDLPSDLEMNGTASAKVKFKGVMNQSNSFYGDLNIEDGRLNYQGLQLEEINGSLGVNDYGVKVEELSAQYQNNPVSINGSIFGWEQQQLNLGYQVSNFELSNLNPISFNKLKLDGQATLRGEIEGTVLNPTIRSIIKADKVEIATEKIKDITAELYYKDQVLNLEKAKLTYQQGQVNLDGTLDFNDTFNYIINTKFNNLALSELDFDFLSTVPISGSASGEAIISGEKFAKNKLNVLGSMKLNSGMIKGYKFKELSSKFWLNNAKLFLNNTNLQAENSSASLNGVINLAGDLNLDLEVNDLKLAQLDQVHGLDSLTGRIDIKGKINGNLSEPQLSAEVKGKEINHSKLNLGALTGLIDINKEQVDITKLAIPKYSSQLVGKINFAKQSSNLILETTGLEAAEISSLIDSKLDLTGKLTAVTKIKSLFSKPQIKSDLEVDTGSILGKQNFDSLDLKLKYDYQEKNLMVEQGNINYKNSKLKLSGTMTKEKLNFNFSSSGLVWEDINFTDKLEDLVGSAEVEGSIYGSLDNPKLAAKFNTSEIEFSNNVIGDVKGRIDYKNDNLYLTDIKVQNQANQYQLSGSLNLAENKIRQVNVGVTKGSLAYLNQFLPYPLGISYQFSGQIEAKGDLNQPKFDIELVIEDNDESGTLEVAGDYLWLENSDLDVVATNFNLDVLNKFELIPYYLNGNLNLTGTVTGKLTEPNFKSQLKVTNGKVANLSYNSLAGSIQLINGEKIILDQRLQVEGENIAQAAGQIPLISDQKFDFNLKLQEGNLSVLPLLVSEIGSATGKGNANLEVKGTLANPKLKGTAEVIAGSFSHPLFDRQVSNLNGKVRFKNNKLFLNDIIGYYGDGNFSGQGAITLDGLMIDEYDLELRGQEIPFEHGSWQGENDLDVTITGSWLRPEIKGEIKAYDTRFSLPVDWPKFNKKKNDKEDKIKPQLDLTVIPKQNVRVVNDQIDILVQRGTLNLLTVDDKIEIIGELGSNAGQFNYYNTEFELQEARAIFRQYGYIPNLQLEAETEIYDSTLAKDENSLQQPYHTVYLNLTGPANQLDYQLSSDSNLSEEEIVALLTGQGGLGNLLDKNYEDALTSELRRVIGEEIKKEVIYKVERSFEQSLDLDQVRIKSLLEDNDSVEIEVGKFIFENFMLKYNHSFLEESKAIGFEYYFGKGIDNLMIQGDYNSSGEYELGLEASIPFE